MEYKDLTDEQKEFIKGKYENIKSELIDCALTDYRIDPYNGYEYVDMGEAGIWTKYPIGVTEWNEDWMNHIKYFQWGDIEGYTKDQVGTEKQFSDNWSDYKHSSDGDKLTKYCNNPSYGYNGFTDDLTILLPEDDACVQKMGGNWRMPTIEEFKNLYKLCTETEVKNYNGISGLNGYLLKLRTDNSKQLFLPHNGYCFSKNLDSNGGNGYFWTSSLSSDTYAHCIRMDVDHVETRTFPRNYGFSIIGTLDSNE